MTRIPSTGTVRGTRTDDLNHADIYKTAHEEGRKSLRTQPREPCAAGAQSVGSESGNLAQASASNKGLPLCRYLLLGFSLRPSPGANFAVKANAEAKT